MDSLTERLRRIADRLARLRGAGAERFGRAHGVSSHHFMLFAPVSEAELRAFEREHGVELVPEHRAFLAALGTGAGPAYGILPLRDALRGPAPEPGDEATFLRTPFPHPYGAHTGERGRGDDIDLLLRHAGTLSICETGCGGFVQLVVTGPARGRLLDFTFEGHVSGWRPEGGFLDWYEAWLDRFFVGEGAAMLAAADAELDAYERRLQRR